MTLPKAEQPLEIRDATGAIVGFVVTEKHFRELLREREALQKERDDLRDQVVRLEEQSSEAGRELDEARKAVSDFEKTWEAWNEYGVIPPREREIERARESGIRGGELIKEIESILYPASDEGVR
jgi:predicted  nucleic acid-binding Zn-ribbon protein